MRLGTTHLIEPRVVDAVVACARTAFPEREVLVELGSTAELQDMLARGVLDLVVDYLPIGRPGVRSRNLATYRMGIVVRVEDPLADRSVVAMSDVVDRAIQLPADPTVPVAPVVARLRADLRERGARDVRIYPASDIVRLAEHVRRTGELALSFVGVRTGAARVYHEPSFRILPMSDGPEMVVGRPGGTPRATRSWPRCWRSSPGRVFPTGALRVPARDVAQKAIVIERHIRSNEDPDCCAAAHSRRRHSGTEAERARTQTVKAAPFSYSAPDSLDEVLEILDREPEDAKVLAGGQSLAPVMAMRLSRFERLVDLQRVPGLVGITRVDGAVQVAAMTTHAAVGRDAVATAVPLLAKAAPLIGHDAIRNRGTLGGALAHADPAAEWPAVAAALDAELEVAGSGGVHTVPAADFFLGTWTTAMDPTEVLVAARFPVWEGTCGFAVEEAARRHGDFAMAGALCGVQLTAGRVTRAALVHFGVGGTPLRAAEAEAALVGSAVDQVDAAEVAALAVRGLEPVGDLHASGEQRRRMARALTERAVTNAIKEASGG